MSDENKVDTPSGDENQPGSDQKDTPTEGQKDGGSQSSEGEKSEKSEQNGDSNAILADLAKSQKEILGRLTKLEQAKKHGKTAAVKSEPKNPGGKFSFKEPEQEEEDNQDSLAAEDAIEFAKVQTGAIALIMENEQYAKVYKGDKTLQRIIKKDPLQLLDGIPVDAEDALDQIKDYLESRVEEFSEDKKGNKDDQKPAPKPAPQQPKDGGNKDDKDKSPNRQPQQSGVMDKVKDSIKGRVLGQS